MSYIKEIKVPRIETEIIEPLNKVDYWNEDLEELDKDQKKKKLIVENVLKNNTQARNSDFILFFECLRQEFRDIEVKDKNNYLEFKIPKEIFKSNISPESYRRSRQKFNQEGKYLPTNQRVLERRKRKERTMKIYFSKLKENDK